MPQSVISIRLAIRQCAAWASTLINQNIPERRKTRSTIEVAQLLHYFASERRGYLTPSRRDVNLDLETKSFVVLGHGIIRRDAC